ncbi:MAG: SpoIIE family protein phosphatase [Bryobacteraceae bacterium]
MLRRRWPEILFGLALAVWVGAWFSGAVATLALLTLPMVALGGVVGVRLGRHLLRPLIWRLRNRLAVVYLFIAVIPILLILTLSRQAAIFLGEQVAAHLVQSELGHHTEFLRNIAWMLAHSGVAQRSERAYSMGEALQQRYPGIEASVNDAYHDPVAGWGDTSGVMARKGKLYVWAHAVNGATCVTVHSPLTRRWLGGLVPGLGPVSVLPDPASETDFSIPAEESDPPVPIAPATNRFDEELRWGHEIPVARWDMPGRHERGLLGVRTRFSSLIGVLTSGGGRASLPNALWVFGLLFLLAQAASIYIGVTVTRTITSAVDDLHEGTHHVSQGDFSWRIPEKGEDQVAGLGRSFNQMTGEVERLLEVAKESERLKAEVEIARRVQAQLFPQAVPRIPGLELFGACSPARMVSGDYYDYQPAGSRYAIAIGDVAGKGISAALLMSSLQAYFRMQLEELGRGEVALAMETINRHLHAATSAEKYATLFLGVYDHTSGELIYTNAGHLPPLLIRGGKAEPLEVNGMVVGAFPFAKYTESRISLEPGDLLVGFTDGVTEPENSFGEMYGEERLAALFVRTAALPSDQILEEVDKAVTAHTGSGELQDDLTMLIARRAGAKRAALPPEAPPA